jgi:hypothetical protein
MASLSHIQRSLGELGLETSFTYASVPLLVDQIRILTLQPSKDAGTRPACTLEAASLDEAPVFTALSYAWGDASKRTLVEVNGSTLSITSALDSALRHLRLPDRERRLWIDQICINQADDDEKASQVQLMRQIYSQAENTVAWLGEARNGSDRVMQYIQEAGREGLQIGLRDVPRDDYASLRWHVTTAFSNLNDHDLAVEQDDPLGTKKRDLCKLIDSNYSEIWDDVLDQLFLLFGRPYFMRGWIKQEVVIPKMLILQCGQQTVGGDEFVSFVRLDSFIMEAKRQRWMTITRQLQKDDKDAVTAGNLDAASAKARAERSAATMDSAQIINTEKFNQRFGLGQTVGIRSRYHMGGHWQDEMTLSFMLKTLASDLQFTDPRDRVFGLLGMASDTAALQIQVDYSVPWQAVYADAIKRIIHSGDVDILHDIYSAPSPGLPSWAPDLSTAKAGIIKKYTFLSTHPFSAGGISLPAHRVPSPSQFSSPTTLLLRGFRIDTVLSVGPTWTRSRFGYYPETLSSVKQAVVKLFGFSRLSATNPARAIPRSDPLYPLFRRRNDDPDAGIRTAIIDHETIVPGSGAGRKRRATRERMHAALKELADGQQENHGPELEDFLFQAAVLEEYASWLGEKGFIGLAPRRVREGDVVVVFYGSSVPFVLRPTGDSGGTYTFVGEAYCDGIMDGEVLGLGLEDTTFTLV